MSETKYYITPAGNEIIIREGKAVEQLPLKEPKIIIVSGDIHSISNYVNIRKTAANSSQCLDASKILVEVDKVAKTITMRLDPENHYGATVTGKLEQSAELQPWGINADRTFDRQALAKLIKFNSYYFDDKNEHAGLIAGLYKLRVKSEQEIQQEKDNAGNRKNSVEIKVIEAGEFRKEFILNIPIFKGFPAQRIKVEICMEVMNGGIQFNLESVGLKELTDSQVDDIFKTELDSCEDYVIINK